MAYVTIVGNVGNVKELKHSQQGKPFIKFSVAWSERVRDTTGAYVDGPNTWVQCTAFGKLAESIADNLQKGNRVVVSGQMKAEEWSRDTGPETVVTLAADAVGVDLTFQDVQINRRNGNGGGQRQQPQQSQQGGDPWNSAPQQNQGGFTTNEEPPF